MSFHVEQVEFAGVKTNMIWCSSEPDPEPQPCAFCPTLSPLLCDWPICDKQVEVRADEVLHGDRVWISRSRTARLGIAEVLGIFGVGAVLVFKLRTNRGSYEWVRHPTAMVTLLRPGTCDAPMCDLHTREVGDDLHYCQTHWRAWEDAA